PPGMLMDLQDYVLFKDAIDNVIVEGRFGANWRMPEADAEKMQQTGVINFNKMTHDAN
ncbi:hypothetical protein HUU40_27945, partial [candidate division KSB1 bacterium]|nr:hypothetical protein [candidate division KSB1 bacterium]